MCLILFPLLFWGVMPYDIFSVPLYVLCTRNLLHLVTMNIYHLASCELMFLILVGLMVCGL